jgi:hypothetical protein
MYGDDAARCSNGLTAQKFREATPEERVVYRRWLRSTIALYAVLFAMCAIVAAVSYSSVGIPQLTNVSMHTKIVSSKAN